MVSSLYPEVTKNRRFDMVISRTFVAVVMGLVAIGLPGTAPAGDWEKAPIDDLGGLQNALTDLKDPEAMELGRRGRIDGHPAAWGETEVECLESPDSANQWCTIQLEIIFSKHKFSKDRVKIQVLDGDEQPLKTAYLLNPTSDDVRARVYFIGVEYIDGLKPNVRVAIRSDKSSIKGHARVTFLRADLDKEDKTNWQVASNWPLYNNRGLRLDRPTYLFMQ